MMLQRLSKNTKQVALLAEGVDRNNINLTDKEQAARRPPRGGRG